MGGCLCTVQFFGRANDMQFETRLLLQCTCDEDNCIYCEKCDAKLLSHLSDHVATESDMRQLGIELGIHPDVIRACGENNRNNINNAVFDMLYHRWYKTQDGLRRTSSGLKELEQAVVHAGRADLWQIIVRNYVAEL